jgi:hypothetical protein
MVCCKGFFWWGGISNVSLVRPFFHVGCSPVFSYTGSNILSVPVRYFVFPRNSRVPASHRIGSVRWRCSFTLGSNCLRYELAANLFTCSRWCTRPVVPLLLLAVSLPCPILSLPLVLLASPLEARLLCIHKPRTATALAAHQYASLLRFR